MSLLDEYPQLSRVQTLALRRKAKVYLVGGSVRDFLLRRPTPDLDFAVDGNAVGFARSFARAVRGAFVLLDKEHGCARVVQKERRALRTFDFADLRAPTLRADLGHRDFTINAMAVDLERLQGGRPLEKILYDPKQGRRDLRARRIRMAAAGTFREDPLRLLRAFSLRAQLDFTIGRETMTRIRRDRDLIGEVSAERVRDELFKILSSPRCAPVLRQMDRAGFLDRVIAQVTVMYGVPQGGYHHLDVWRHSLETVAQMEQVFGQMAGRGEVMRYLREPLAGDRSRMALMKLAALLHDIGKPDTRRRQQGRISFHGHEHVGKKIVRSVALALKLSTRERRALEDMVLFHLRPGYLSNFRVPGERALFRYFRDTGEEAAAVALLSLADQRATRGPLTSERDQKHHEKICLELVERFFKKKTEVPLPRLITGHDLIRTLKLAPSPLFARILAEVEEKQAVGKVRDRGEALELARGIARVAGGRGVTGGGRKKGRA